ncbi:MAG: indole-3-glycerol phosphate synthase TrpC [Gemmatimonadetes bacterium]|nr:indole-3-glycerol phosphate synthase TrpC [Gemmatimonadota bacterium]
MKAEPQAPRVLEGILAETARRVEARRGERSAWERRAEAARPAPNFAEALRAPVVAVIAEVKRRSPSAGAIRAEADAVALSLTYAEAGAAAVSVLTEEAHFGGSLDDLSRVSAAIAVPTLRKDFIIDPLQVYEARAAGASAVLLIVRVLSAERLEELARLAREIGLATLVEVHEAAELEAAMAARPTAIGVNARDLDTLAIEPARVESLLALVPSDLAAVAESGLSSRADVERVAAFGADAVLVGSAVAGAPDPGAALRALVGVPCGARRGPR